MQHIELPNVKIRRWGKIAFNSTLHFRPNDVEIIDALFSIMAFSKTDKPLSVIKRNN